jgi:pyruvate dehydrogenase E2 component (dihydrolipoamide acetyltransferase)
MTDFLLPELGENVASGDVLRVLVKAGDMVERDQPVLELETDKATIEVPSSVSGRVGEVRVKEGQKLQVGEVVFTVEETAAAEPQRTAPKAAEAASADEASSRGEAAPRTPERGTKASPPSPGREHDAVAADASGQDRAASLGRGRGKTAAPPSSELDGIDELDEETTGEAASQEDEEEPAVAASAAAGPVEFRLPSLGENVAGGDVLHVLVKVGDEVVCDQPLLELETDKATIEVPSTVEGRVSEVRVKDGDRIEVGDVAFVIEASGRSATKASTIKVERVHAAAPPGGEAGTFVHGTGPEDVAPTGGLDQHVSGQLRRPAEDKPGMLEDALEESRAEAALRTGIPRGAVVSMPPREEGARRPAPAAPSVRRTARELGVDIGQVTGSGPGGRISSEDVKAHVKRVMSSGGPRPAASEGAPGLAAPAPLPDFSKWGPIERKPMRAVRRKTAEHLSRAWVTVPHVTQCDKADITDLEALRERFARRAEAAGGKLTVTAVALKVVAAALKAFPQVNASADMTAEEIVYKQYVHVGVAVDTDRGLLVPVIRDVDRKSIVALSIELAQAAERARAGKAALEEMQGGCFTITNLGGIGGTYFTPIVNHPEVAILGLSRARMEPVWKDGQFQPRLMLPLSLSYDHRVIDGADAIRFLRWIAEAMEQPFLLSLLG